MGILSWVGGNNRGEKGASKDVRPVLEQLEPRLLLSADLAGIEPTLTPDAPVGEHAIYVDLDQEQTGTLPCPAILTVDLGQSPQTELAIDSGQIDGDDSGEEESLAEEAQLAEITSPLDDVVETEETISSSSSGQVTCVAQAECCDLDAALEEETAGSIVGDQQEIISISETPCIEIRGPPLAGSDSLTAASEDLYSQNGSFVISAGDEGALSSEEPIAPELPGLQLVDPDPSNLRGQVIYLDFDGAEDVVYDGPATVGPFDIPAFQPPGELAGQEQAIIDQVLANLQESFAGSGVIFTATQPVPGAEYSTIYVGGDDSAFSEYGSFLGLAEQVDVGNREAADDGLVFGGFLGDDGIEDYARALAGVVAHEVGHLLGYQHEDGPSKGLLSGVAIDVSGEITEDTVWDDVSEPYRITGDLTIASGVTLTLGSGIELQITDDVEVYGRLVVPDATVGFESSDSIRVHSGGELQLSGSTVEADNYAGFMTVYDGGSAEISGVAFTGAGVSLSYQSGSSGVVADNTGAGR